MDVQPVGLNTLTQEQSMNQATVVQDNTLPAAQTLIPPHPPKKSSFSWIILIIIIAVISFSVSGYLLFGTKSQTNKPLSQLPSANISQTVIKPTSTIIPLTLTLESPAEGDVLSGNEITVKGKTVPNATVAIYSENSENVVESDPSGNFETKITLVIGINSLNVTAFSDSGEEKSVTINIVRDN